MSQFIFKFGTHEIRAFVVDDKPWFVARDVALALGYEDPATSVLKNVPEKYKMKAGSSPTFKGLHPQTILISEPGLYRLVMRSRIAGAEEFQDWVVEEVLPQIRQTGNYIGSVINLYVLPKPTTWQQMFDWKSRHEAQRLGIPYPTYLRLIYETMLPSGVIEEISRRNPAIYSRFGGGPGRRYRQHQFIAENMRPEFRQSLNDFLALSAAADGREQLTRLVSRYKGNRPAITSGK